MDTWYLASWFKTREAYTAFEHLFQPRFTHTGSDLLLRKWKAEADSEFDDDFPCRYPLLGPAGSKWTLQELSQTVDSGDDVVNDDNSLFIAVGYVRIDSETRLTIPLASSTNTVFDSRINIS